MVNTVQAVSDLPLSFDTTNLAAIEAGLKLAKRQAMINSTSAEPERLEKVPLVAAQYGAKLIALCMGKSGIPMSAEERVSIAIDQLVPRAMEVGIPLENLYIDPLVLTVAGCQEYVPARHRGGALCQAGHGPRAAYRRRAEQRLQPRARPRAAACSTAPTW